MTGFSRPSRIRGGGRSLTWSTTPPNDRRNLRTFQFSGPVHSDAAPWRPGKGRFDNSYTRGPKTLELPERRADTRDLRSMDQSFRVSIGRVAIEVEARSGRKMKARSIGLINVCNWFLDHCLFCDI